MPWKYYMPNGGYYLLDDSISQDEADDIARQKFPEQFAPPESTVKGAFVSGLKRLGSEAQELAEIPFKGVDEAAERAARRERALTEEYGTGASFEGLSKKYEDEGIFSAAGELAKQSAMAVAGSVPYMAELGVGAMAGPLGLAAAAYAPRLASNIQEQATVQREKGKPVDIDVAEAAGYAAPMAALDVAAQAIPLGKTAAGKIFGPEVAKLLSRGERTAAEEAAKDAIVSGRGLWKSMAAGTAKNLVAQDLIQPAEVALDRLQSDQDLLSDDALSAYGEAIYMGTIMSPMGAIEGVSERSAARGRVAERTRIAEEKAKRIEEEKPGIDEESGQMTLAPALFGEEGKLPPEETAPTPEETGPTPYSGQMELPGFEDPLRQADMSPELYDLETEAKQREAGEAIRARKEARVDEESRQESFDPELFGKEGKLPSEEAAPETAEPTVPYSGQEDLFDAPTGGLFGTELLSQRKFDLEAEAAQREAGEALRPKEEPVKVAEETKLTEPTEASRAAEVPEGLEVGHDAYMGLVNKIHLKISPDTQWVTPQFIARELDIGIPEAREVMSTLEGDGYIHNPNKAGWYKVTDKVAEDATPIPRARMIGGERTVEEPMRRTPMMGGRNFTAEEQRRAPMMGGRNVIAEPETGRARMIGGRNLLAEETENAPAIETDTGDVVRGVSSERPNERGLPTSDGKSLQPSETEKSSVTEIGSGRLDVDKPNIAKPIERTGERPAALEVADQTRKLEEQRLTDLNRQKTQQTEAAERSRAANGLQERLDDLVDALHPRETDRIQNAINMVRRGVRTPVEIEHLVKNAEEKVAGAEGTPRETPVTETPARSTPPVDRLALIKAAQEKRKNTPRTQLGDTTAAAGVHVDTARSVADGVVSKWKNAPNVNVVQSITDLPEHLRMVDPSAKGLYDPSTKTVHVIADNAHADNPHASVKATVFHESLGHFGFARAFGDGLDTLLNNLHKTNKTVRDRTNAWLERNPNAYKDSPDRTARAVEEVFAEMSERGETKAPTGLHLAFTKVADFIGGFLERMGLKQKDYGKAERREIFDTLRRAHESVTEGREVASTEKVGKGEVRYDKPEYLNKNFFNWFGNSKVVDEKGSPVVVYRGVVGDNEKALNAEARSGYASFGSTSPHVAASYGPEHGQAGAVIPLYIKANDLIEFPVTTDKNGRRQFDKFEFDRRARSLGPGQVLVARKVVDIGPRANVSVDPKMLYSYSSDVYAWNKGTSVKSATGNTGEFSQKNADIRYQLANNVREVTSVPNPNEAEASSKFQRVLEQVLEQHGDKPLVANVINAVSRMPTDLFNMWNKSQIIFGLERTYGHLSENLPVLVDHIAMMDTDKITSLADATKSLIDMRDTIYNAVQKYGRNTQIQFNKFIDDLTLTQADIWDLDAKTHTFTNNKDVAALVADVRSGKKKLESLDPETQQIHRVASAYYNLPKEVQKTAQQYFGYFNKLSERGTTATKRLAIDNIKDASIKEKILKAHPVGNLKYFVPRTRSGNYVLRFTTANGEVYVSQHESPAARAIARKQIVAEGAKDIVEEMRNPREARSRTVPTGLLGEVLQSVKQSQTLSAEAAAKMTEAEIKAHEAKLTNTLNAIYDGFLEFMPNNVVKNAKGRTIIENADGTKQYGYRGAEQDALQVFEDQVQNIVYQINKVKWGTKLDDAFTAVRKDLFDKYYDGKSNLNEAQTNALLNDLAKRVEFAKDPVYNKLTNLNAKVNYYWSIAGNISSALTNTTVLPMFVAPNLQGKYGVGKTTKAMTLATRLYPAFKELSNKGLLDGEHLAEHRTAFLATIKNMNLEEFGVTPEQLIQFNKYLLDRSAIGYGALHELELSQASLKGYEKMSAKANYILGLAFKETEQFNRGITHLSSFLLDMDKRRGTSDALTRASREAYLFNGEMNSSASPTLNSSYYQTNLGRVLLQFRTFPLNMAIQTAKVFKQAMSSVEGKGEEARIIRTVARRQLLGIMAMTYAFAGIRGLPLYGMANVLASLVYDKDDEPFDLDQEIIDSVGTLGLNGIMNQVLGVDTANRTGFNGLLYRDDPKRLAEVGYASYIMERGLGPTMSILQGIDRAKDAMAQGRYERAIEYTTPAAVRNILKGARYYREGAKTIGGLPIKDDVGLWSSSMQVLGFNPTEISELTTQTTAMKAIDTKLLNRKTILLTKLNAARVAGDMEEMQEIMEEINEFRAKNPGMFKQNTISASFRQHDATARQAVHGLYLPASRRMAVEQYVADVDEDEE